MRADCEDLSYLIRQTAAWTVCAPREPLSAFDKSLTHSLQSHSFIDVPSINLMLSVIPVHILRGTCALGDVI